VFAYGKRPIAAVGGTHRDRHLPDEVITRLVIEHSKSPDVQEPGPIHRDRDMQGPPPRPRQVSLLSFAGGFTSG